jgi:Spy/CpxP family protein refolding chaperone
MKNALFIVLGLALTTPLAAGCSGATMSDGSVATANEAETKAPVARGAHGPVKFLGEALGEVPLSPAQRTEIERLAAEAELRHAPVAAARRDVVETLATQIEAGHLDRAALEAKIDAVAAAAEGTRAADRAALERLHFVLDDEQRSELVDAIEDKIHEGWHGRGGPHAHMQEWRAALKLTDDQVSRIHEALRVQFEAHRGDAGAHFRDGMRKGKRALEAF